MYFHLFIPHPRHVSYCHFACHIHFFFAYVPFFYLSDFCFDFIDYHLAVLLFVLVIRNVIDLRCSNPTPLYRVL